MIPEHLRVRDECELDDVQELVADAFKRIQTMKCNRPGYAELGPALIFLSKANDMLQLAKEGVRS